MVNGKTLQIETEPIPTNAKIGLLDLNTSTSH